MASLEELEAEIAELRQLLYNATHGRIGARGIYIGSKRLLADANHLYQEDSDGTKSRLDDVTGEETPKAHAASHTDGTDDIQDTAADDSTKGIATFEADDFDDASGKIDLATAVCKSAPTDSGTATPSTHALTIAGGTNASTAGSGATVTINVDDKFLKNDASDTTSGTITAAGLTTTGIATLQAVAIDSTPANDTCSGVTTELTAGAALTRGDCCYIGSDNKMEKTDADAEATSRCIAIVEEATIAENAAGTFLLHGFFEKEFNFGANIGKRVYLDTATAGGVTLTQPSGEDDCIVIVGIVMGDDLLYFNPSVQAIVEHEAP